MQNMDELQLLFQFQHGLQASCSLPTAVQPAGCVERLAKVEERIAALLTKLEPV